MKHSRKESFYIFNPRYWFIKICAIEAELIKIKLHELVVLYLKLYSFY